LPTGVVRRPTSSKDYVHELKVNETEATMIKFDENRKKASHRKKAPGKEIDAIDAVLFGKYVNGHTKGVESRLIKKGGTSRE